MLDALTAFEIGRLPRITFGAGSFGRLPGIVARHGSRALLVTGAHSFVASPRFAELERGLADADVELVGVVAVAGEPGPADVEGAVEAYRPAGVGVVVGVGGGSALDAAKAVAGLLRSGTTLLDHLEGVGRGIPYAGPAIPTVAAPTTAGTGSEATRNAVITDRRAGYKRSFRDERLVPADAVVDPDLLDGASRERIAANGLDALAQLLESSTSRNATPITDALTRSGLAAVRDGLEAWHRAPDGPDASGARSRMAYAALLSGICLANAGLGAVHGLASPLGARLPIPHGMACGAVLWMTVEATIAALTARSPGNSALERYAEAGRILADLPADTPGDEARAALVETLRGLVGRLGIPRLSTFGMTSADIAPVVADSPGSSMRANPVALTDAELTHVLEQAL